MSKLFLRVGAVSVAAVVAVSGCGTDGATTADSKRAAPADPKVALAAAVKKADTGGSARVNLVMNIGGETVTMKGPMKFTVPPVGQFDMTTVSKSKPAERNKVVMTPEAMYVESADMAKETGKSWIRLGYADMNKARSPQGKMFAKQLQQDQDPRQWLKLMLASQDLTTVGTEKVAGATASHYRGTINTNTALADTGQLTGLSATERAKLRQQMSKLNLDKLDVDIWVTEDGWPAKIEAKGGDGASRMAVTQELSDFGTPVTVTKPPAAKVQDFADLLKVLEQAQKGSGSS